MKLVKLDRHHSVNPEMVASVRADNHQLRVAVSLATGEVIVLKPVYGKSVLETKDDIEARLMGNAT